jgi:hypothetical protein
MYRVAIRDPVVRRASLTVPEWPAGSAPVRVALLTDVHVAGPDMPPSRVARIVQQVNALKPDIVLLGGDFVSDKTFATRTYPASKGLAPLARLKARFGTFAVLGNHDHWRDVAEVRAALHASNVRVLDNEAVTVGPLRLGGVDDDFTNHADMKATVAAIRSGPGTRVLLSHSPDVAALAPADVGLVLAGHTHCGQIQLPVIGDVDYQSRYGRRYSCGMLPLGHGRRIIISAGVGTSILPLRLGAVPDLWLVTLRPKNR